MCGTKDHDLNMLKVDLCLVYLNSSTFTPKGVLSGAPEDFYSTMCHIYIVTNSHPLRSSAQLNISNEALAFKSVSLL